MRSRWAIAALACIALGVAGCAGGSGSGGSSGNGTVTTITTAAGVTPGSLEQSYERAISRAAPSVVEIRSASGLGSGIVLDTKGDIVTNAHVVGDGTSFTVVTSAGKQYPARLVGSFPPNDVAVVHVSGADLRPATFADSSRLKPGEIVLAMGSPLGLQSSVTDGIVSAVGRTVGEPNGVTLPNVIQTSAAINPGNSGGALVDIEGHVVGIPTLAATDAQLGGAAPGIGFGIPSNTATNLAEQIVQHGKVVRSHRAYLGVEIGSLTGAEGVLVVAVKSGGPAAQAGIRAGDVIVRLNGHSTPSAAALQDILANLNVGASVPVVVRHQDGSQSTVTIKLGSLPG
jgi:S1-C subfamily serine protease